MTHTEELIAAAKDAANALEMWCERIGVNCECNACRAQRSNAINLRHTIRALESTPPNSAGGSGWIGRSFKEPPTPEPEGMDVVEEIAQKMMNDAYDPLAPYDALTDIGILILEIRSLRQRLATAEQANTPLWEYVWAMESVNVSMDEGGLPSLEQIARINAAQERLKAIRALPTTQQEEPHE